ncbi:hypothetical protein AB0B45_48165 [Nonomuraea sp. NPDC049152]|uniref:hypothetical protein n=1 Tax=Nonomuraea sp. NPDC049152 TaxID=3154350 RepID=UPI00340B40B4
MAIAQLNSSLTGGIHRSLRGSDMVPTTRRPLDNLPATFTSFVGRRRELTDVKRLLPHARVVTLTGVGGGRDTAGLRLAADLRRAFRDEVWLVDLSALGDAELLVHTVEQLLGISDQPDRPPLEVVAERIGDRQMLLVDAHGGGPHRAHSGQARLQVPRSDRCMGGRTGPRSKQWRTRLNGQVDHRCGGPTVARLGTPIGPHIASRRP